MKRRTVAVIVTYNRLDALKITVPNTLAEPFYKVVVVNNASTDGTRDWLKSLDDTRLELVHCETNGGGAGGFNIGFRHVAEQLPEAEWLVAFDDDAWPQAGALEAFDALEVPDEVGSLAAAVYLPDGRISEMNRPSWNPFWHLSEFFKTARSGRAGFHVVDAEYRRETPLEIDASSFVGYFLRLKPMREGRFEFPRPEIFIYADDIIFILGLRKAGLKHWFVPQVRFSHDCKTLVDEKDIYSPQWRAYFIVRNRLEMYRVAAGWFYPLVFAVKIPKFLWDVRHHPKEERKSYRCVMRKAAWHGITGNYSLDLSDVKAICSVCGGGE